MLEALAEGDTETLTLAETLALMEGVGLDDAGCVGVKWPLLVEEGSSERETEGDGLCDEDGDKELEEEC